MAEEKILDIVIIILIVIIIISLIVIIVLIVMNNFERFQQVRRMELEMKTQIEEIKKFLRCSIYGKNYCHGLV